MRIAWRQCICVLVLAGGCAHPPRPQCDYLDATAYLRTAATGGEVIAPATLPLEAEFSGPHPLDYYMQVALQRNARILAAQGMVAAEAQTIPQVTALPDPMVTDKFWPIPANSPQTASGRMPNSLMLSQELPWISKLRVQGEMAEQETKIALAQLAQTRLEVAEQVQLAYYDLYYYQQAIRITRQNQTRVGQLIDIARVRSTTPQGRQTDTLRAELEADRLRDQLIELERQLRMVQADLAALLHASPETAPLASDYLELPPTPVALDSLYDLAVRCRPELQQQLYQIVREERGRELARLEYIPDFSVGVGWDWMTTSGALAPSADGNDNLGFSVGASLPIWQDKLRAGVREAEYRVLQSARGYDATRDDTFRQVRRLVTQASSYEQQLALFGEAIVPRAQQTLELSMSSYSVGTADFFDVVEDYRELLVLEIQVERLRANLGQTLASLERVIGCQLAPSATEAEPMPMDPFPLPQPPRG